MDLNSFFADPDPAVFLDADPEADPDPELDFQTNLNNYLSLNTSLKSSQLPSMVNFLFNLEISSHFLVTSLFNDFKNKVTFST